MSTYDRPRASPARTASREQHGRRRLAVLQYAAAGAGTFGILVMAAVGGAVQAGPNLLWVGLVLLALVYEFQKRIDEGIPLLHIAGLLAVLQWLVGPAVAYAWGLDHYRYYMYVPEPVYFSFALPGTCAFVFGLLAVGASVRQRWLLGLMQPEQFFRIGVLLLGIGAVARALAAFSQGGLAFLLHLLSQVSYVGAIYFICSRHPYRWWLVALCLTPLLIRTAESAMFHDLLLWASLIFCYWYALRERSAVHKASILTVAALFVFTIQGIKQDYRSQVWSGQQASLLEEIFGFWWRSDPSEAEREALYVSAISRLNQGWIISAVMSNVPAQEPFAEGETIRDAVVSALVPRFLAPDKKGAGGQENFRRFTGLPLAQSTSMAISPLGEAYANFGALGGVLLMLGFGLVFSLFYGLCLRYCVRHPDFLFWIPIIFYQAIKAETEFVTVLNQMSKGAMFAFGLYWLIHTKLIPMMGARHRMERPMYQPSGEGQYS